MPAKTTNSLSSIGFMTVCEHDDQGLFGGLLVLNLAGRPLEFHCTAPVRPNRAQEILYGPTLRPYLYGEQIGRALMERVGATPDLVFTDVQPALSLRQLTSVPVVFVPPVPATDTSGSDSDLRSRVDREHQGPASPALLRLHNFTIGGVRLAVPETHREDESRVVRQWQSHAEDFDLAEPFGRIREAIEEARRTAR